jgi:hypothetical protein
MTWLVYSGGGSSGAFHHFEEAEDLAHALEIASYALEAANEFAARMGWTPYWAELVEIRRCPVAVWREWWRDSDAVAARSALHLDAAAIRKRLDLPQPTAPRPVPKGVAA